MEKNCLLLSGNKSFQDGEKDIGALTEIVESYWQDYKAVRLQGIYYGTFFQDNLSLIDWVNSQSIVSPLVCLGDGHFGGVEFV